MKYYDTMGFESEHGVYVRQADADALAAEVAEMTQDRNIWRTVAENKATELRAAELHEANGVAHSWRADAAEARVEALEAENARLNMEMAAYHEKLTPQDAAAMKAVMDALYAEKHSRTALASPPPASKEQEPNFLFDVTADFCDRHETAFKLGERCPKCSTSETESKP